MLSQERIKLVRKQLRAGMPEGEIKNELIKEGYSEQDMENIFIAHKPDMRGWYLFFAIVFFLIGFYTLITTSSFLFLVFSAAMFSVYYLEKGRIKKSST